MRTRLRFLLVAAAAAALVAAIPAAGSAGPAQRNTGRVPTTAAWQNFQWGSDGVAGPFYYTSAAPLYLEITDSYCRGDQFSIEDNGVDIGDTPAVEIDPDCENPLSTPILSYKDKTYSSGEFVLAPGSHTVIITAIQNPFGGGGGFIGAWFQPAPQS